MSPDPFDLAGKHAVVTGGSRGIGGAIAAALSDRGARVSVVSRSPHESRYFSVAADVASEDSVTDAFERVRERHGPITVLVNNSGISESAPILRTTTVSWDRIIAVNLTGTFLCTRAALADMISAQCGRVLNVSSIAGLSGAPYIAAYCASKHGVIGLTRAAAAELVGTGITVNAVCPGYTDTAMMAQALENITKFTKASAQAARDALAKMNPQGRIATVEEVAQAAIALMMSDRTGVARVVPGDQEA